MNADNFLRLANKAILSKNHKYLADNRYIPALNPKMTSLLSLEEESKVNFLKQMCEHLSAGEK